MCMILIFGALLALLLILPLRGIMNAVSRIDYISQRLDDYPRINAAYVQEIDNWRNWWLHEAYDQRAEQAAFLYTSDAKRTSEEEKLSYIADLLGAEKAQVLSEADLQSASPQGDAADLVSSSAKLGDGRLIVLDFVNRKNDSSALAEDDSYFMSQLDTGLPGYICVVRNGALSLYPKDENEAALQNMISVMLENGTLDPAALAEKARSEGKKTGLKASLNPGTDGIPARKYLLYSAAYTENEDLVVNISETSTLFRFGRKRSWGLWFLCCSIMFLLGHTLWKTRLFKPGTEPSEEWFSALKRSLSAMFMAVLLLLGSVLVIQMLSGVNLAQQGATDQADSLKMVLQQEAERASKIENEFNNLYLSRAQTASAVLTDNPQLIDTDSLHSLDHALKGAGLRVFNTEGILLASDEVLHNAVDTDMIHLYSSASMYPQGSGSEEKENDGENDSPNRYYRAIMVDENGKTTGWVELCAEQRQLDDLLRETGLQEIVGDLHILDTLHAIAVEKTPEYKIAAGTWKNWIGDTAEDHGIHSELLYDGYEGIINFDGNKCYSVVFSFGDHYVIVGSENETALVFIGGVLILTLLLAIMVMLAVYRPFVKLILAYQKQGFAADPNGKAYAVRKEYPPLQEYLRNFMIAVFLLSAVLYFTTKGNPAGLTYNIVRGTWIRGINAATITTCIMLVSVVFAIQRLLDILFLKLGGYLSPKGMTICRLLDSGFTYIGTIVMIIYALSMFGVNTATLIGGVGATALIFTLGANSLIADVLAGIFIIFEGDFTVGDVVVIDDFRGIVTDIGIRTTKLMDDNSQDIKIINNSEIKDLTNQSRENSAVIIDIPISLSLGVEKAESILKEAIEHLPEQFPKIIGVPEYWGIPKLPEKNPYTGNWGGLKGRIAFNCLEKDKEMLTYQVYRALIDLVSELNGNITPAPSEDKK